MSGRQLIRMVSWGALIAVLIGVGVVAVWEWRQSHATLPSYGQVPEFELTSRTGQPFGSSQLDGQVWIADFIFTRCASTCPMVTARMADVARQLTDTPVRFVTITVDPEYDTPERLDTFAERYTDRTDDQWVFLTGDKARTYGLIRAGFHLGVEDATGDTTNAGGEPFIHSTRLVLVDRTGQIRGYYDGTEEEAAQQLVRDATRLLAAP